MRRNIIRSAWNELNEIREVMKQTWSELTDEDVDMFRGSLDYLIERIEEVYGFTKVKAEEEVENFRLRYLYLFQKLNSDLDLVRLKVMHSVPEATRQHIT